MPLRGRKIPLLYLAGVFVLKHKNTERFTEEVFTQFGRLRIVKRELVKKLLEATGVVMILVRDGKVLLTLRDGNALVAHPHQWELVGGSNPPGTDPRETAYEILNRKFGWRKQYVKLHRIGISAKNVAYMYGDLGNAGIPCLAPGEGALICEVAPAQLIPMVEQFTVGVGPGKFVALFANRLELICDLAEDKIEPHSRLVQPKEVV